MCGQCGRVRDTPIFLAVGLRACSSVAGCTRGVRCHVAAAFGMMRLGMRTRSQLDCLLAVSSVLLGLTASSSGAMPPLRSCFSGDGGLVGNGPPWEWQWSGPFYVSMTQTTAGHIAGRVSPGEFGQKVTASHVPCLVGENVVGHAANAWPAWAGNTGKVRIRWEGPYETGPYVGAFLCDGTSRSDGGAVETCTHNADRYAGHVVVRFTIRAYEESAS